MAKPALHPHLRPAPAAASFGIVGSVKILTDKVPLFETPDLGLKPVGYAAPGKSLMMLGAISGDRLWLEVDTLGGPRWLIAEEGGKVYAKPSWFADRPRRSIEPSTGLGVALGIAVAVGAGTYLADRLRRA